MASFSKKLSMGTSQFAKQAMDMATTSFSAANSAIVAGLQTCDEKGAVKVLRDTELRIGPTGDISYPGQAAQPASQDASSNRNTVPLGTGAVVINVPISAKNCDTQIWGNHSFHFFFDIDTGGVPTAAPGASVNTGRLVARARKSAGGIELPLRCRWKRKVSKEVLLNIFDEHVTEVTSYHVSADDVGCKVYVEAWVPSEEYSDQRAFAEIGPFEMNIATRKNLDNSMAIESTRFPLKLLTVSDPDDSFSSSAARLEDNNVMLHVTSKEIRIVKPGPRGVGFTREWSARYGAEYPSVQMLHTDSSSFEMRLGPDGKDEHLKLSALSRSQRDLLTLTIRCFHARQLVVTTAVIEQITRQTQHRQEAARAAVPLPPLLATTSLHDAAAPSTLDFYVIVHRLLVQVATALNDQQKCARDTSRAVIEKEALEQDITATIEAYQALLLSYQRDESGSLSATKSSLMQTTSNVSIDVTNRAAHTANLEHLLRTSQGKCKELADELELLRRDYRSLEARNASDSEARMASSRAALSASTDNAGDRKKVTLLEHRIDELTRTNADLQAADRQKVEDKAQLSKEVDRLRAQLITMSSAKLHMPAENTESSINSTTVDDLKSEVQRLYSIIDGLNLEKQSALNQVHKLEQTRSELQESFLYIKSKYDDLVADHQSADHQLVHQNNKLSRELRAVNEKSQRLEVEVSEHQEIMEALRAEKNRLTKKNEALAKDLQRNRDEFENSAKRFEKEQSATLTNIRQLEKTIEEHKSSLDDTARIESDLQKLANLIEEKNQKIENLEAECKELRSRIRKLVSMGDAN